MNNDQKAFREGCFAHGFSNLAPHYYARCIGDGVFQTLYTGFTQYVDVQSPYYSAKKRKDNYISIGLRSMYTRWPEIIFIPGRNCGGYLPADLLGCATASFNGIGEQYEQMLEKGLSVLDEIDTQEKMLKMRNDVMKTSMHSRIHSFDLVAPYLVCGQIEDAFFEIDHQYTHAMVGFFKTHDHVLGAGAAGEYIDALQSLRNRLGEATDLWTALITNEYNFIHKYLQKNFECNTALAQKYGIPLSPDFHMRTAALPGNIH